eukprot:CAMPEP_0184333568 /NCGR_PEP_ID=MMETSP1089-20130417/2535_1 /TAXON_ID=38269 ORGANISM="Gloeochaete wittrockiana, Strain SAG46.84" /NCGR_SAMPLE_ID=MMETSP1089 /ASSEMBLY_ACC=CAM_ASM_000445 /LENGTH=78 /DNA_ID=CAMNT_0026657441 /DNA_START=9 /DNA_END=242 /DNA_ORIENTATION=+
MSGVVTTGGVMGFVKKGSKASIIAGTTIGMLYLGSAKLVTDKSVYGVPLAIGTSGVVSIVMWQRFIDQAPPRRFMPSG